jgi:hypothetical protein
MFPLLLAWVIFPAAREERFLAALGMMRVGDGRRSEVAGSVLHDALRKREYVGFFDTFAGEGLALLTAGGYATGVFSVLFAVDPLEEDVEQEVTAKNAKPQKNCNRHRASPGPACITSADSQSVGG